jgi:hypothetical protein
MNDTRRGSQSQVEFTMSRLACFQLHFSVSVVLDLPMALRISGRLRHELWGLDAIDASRPVWSTARKEAQSYKELYDVLLNNPSLVSVDDFNLDNASHNVSQVLKLVGLIQHSWNLSVDDIRGAIASSQLAFLRDPSDEAVQTKVLDLTVRLWLFLPLNYAEGSATLKDLVARKLPQTKRQDGNLSLDFNATLLVRKAGVSLKGTSDLSQHLLLERFAQSGCTVYVFRHAKILALYQAAAHR